MLFKVTQKTKKFFESHDIKFIVFFLLYLWYLYGENVPIYFSLLLSMIFMIPIAIIYELSIMQTFLAYFSTALSISSSILIQTKPFNRLIIQLMIFDTTHSLATSSVYSIFLMIADLYLLFSIDIKFVSYFMISLCFISCTAFQLATKSQIKSTFSFIATLFIIFIGNVFEYRVDPPIALISLIFSLPRTRFPCSPQRLTLENWRSLIYVTLQFIISFYSLYYSVQHNALTLMADSLSSIANNAAFVGAIISDVVTRMKKTERFSFGFISCKPVGDFAAAIIQLVVLYRIFIDTIVAFLQETPEYEDNDPMFLILPIVSLVLTFLGVIFVGNPDEELKHEKKGTCSFDSETLMVICDLFGSIAVVVSSFLISVFKMKFIDPYVSLFNAIMVSIVTIPSILESGTILCLKSSFVPDYNKLGEDTDTEISGFQCPLSEKRNLMQVRVKSRAPQSIKKILKKYAKMHRVYHLTIEQIE